MGRAGPGATYSRDPRRLQVRAAVSRYRTKKKEQEAAAAAEAEQEVAPRAWHREGLDRAGRVIAFIESLKMTRGKSWAGKPFKLKPEQKEWIGKIYATDRRGRRIVSEALLTMARKGGKSEIASALALCHLAGPEAEPRGEVYAAASDKDQAGRIFNNIKAFINEDDDLPERINIKTHDKSCEVTSGEGAGSYYKADER